MKFFCKDREIFVGLMGLIGLIGRIGRIGNFFEGRDKVMTG